MEALLRGFFNELGSGKRIQKGFIGIVQAKEAYWDDLSGKRLDPTLVKGSEEGGAGKVQETRGVREC